MEQRCELPACFPVGRIINHIACLIRVVFVIISLAGKWFHTGKDAKPLSRFCFDSLAIQPFCVTISLGSHGVSHKEYLIARGGVRNTPGILAQGSGLPSTLRIHHPGEQTGAFQIRRTRNAGDFTECWVDVHKLGESFQFIQEGISNLLRHTCPSIASTRWSPGGRLAVVSVIESGHRHVIRACDGTSGMPVQCRRSAKRERPHKTILQPCGYLFLLLGAPAVVSEPAFIVGASASGVGTESLNDSSQHQCPSVMDSEVTFYPLVVPSICPPPFLDRRTSLPLTIGCGNTALCGQHTNGTENSKIRKLQAALDKQRDFWSHLALSCSEIRTVTGGIV